MELLKIYICDIEKRGFGLTKVQFQKLVYNFVKTNGIDHRFNKDTKLAEADWCYKFMNDFKLSFRTPETTSVGRLMCFNETNTIAFFKTLMEVRTEKQYNPHQIFNLDESGLSTVPTKQPKVISPIGVKRVAKVVSAERGKSITVVCRINLSGVYVPPFFYFSSKTFSP